MVLAGTRLGGQVALLGSTEREKLQGTIMWENYPKDGSPNLTGKNVGLLKRIQKRVKEDNPEQEVIFLHCLIHQEALCKSVLQLDYVVKPVVKLVNFIRARGLQHRQFIKFLEEIDADHQDMLYHSNVRWLSLGKVCRQGWELKQETISFLELLEKADDWLCDLAFAVDILTHMNELNVKLQGKDQFVYEMYTNVRAFKTKLALFSKQMSNNSFVHFPLLATLKEPPRLAKKYRKSLDNLHGEFCPRFSDLEKFTSHFSWCHVPLHKTLKRHHRSCSWN
ncbi:general transcription factor II-I repeat domain-containing protein 2B-like [Erpetoichthys calabaricus]|uniref:general transcription factor II-I repeat domain-containing protein 2B-like n=1 Tax=Erpetoichthys calabaricus TaxID=27687 RepID=UPI002233FFB7|nr:general transcription factor II-I repeat domain-containing protein 2B-like [Erpetoichthys calabaricus]